MYQGFIETVDEMLRRAGFAVATAIGRAAMCVFGMVVILVWLLVRRGRKAYECPDCLGKEIEPFIDEPFLDSMYARFSCIRYRCRACEACFFLYRTKDQRETEVGLTR